MGEAETNVVQGRFPEVVRITEQQKLDSYNTYIGRLNEKLGFLNYKDSELIKLLDAVVAGTIWLKEKHDKEGRIAIAYKKKKNVHGGAEANIVVQASYKEIIDEVDSEVKTRNFLSESILLDDGSSSDLVDED